MVSGRDLVLFTRHLYYLAGTGAPLPDILLNMRWEVQNRELNEAVKGLEEQARQGKAFSQALGEYPHIFPDFYIELIQAAEESDSLPEALRELAGYLEEAEKARKSARAAALYPALILNFLLLFVAVIYSQVTPVILKVLETPQPGAPPASGFWIVLFHAIYNPVFMALFLIFVVIIDIIVFSNFKPCAGLLFRIPFISGLIRKAYLVRISRSLGFMLRSGMTMDEALEQAIRIIDLGPVRKSVSKVQEKVASGSGLTEAMEKDRFFSGTFISLVKTGEEKENLPDALLETADQYEKQLEWETRGTLKMVEPALILASGILIGLVLASLFQPLYQVTWKI